MSWLSSFAQKSSLVVIGRGGRFGGFGGFCSLSGRLLGRGCCIGCGGSLGLCSGLLCGSFLRRLCVLCGGVLFSVLGFLLELRQTAQRLHMAAVQIEHIRLEAGDLQTDAVVLPLLSQTLLVGLVLDLVCAVAS